MKKLTQTFEEILNDKSNYVEAKEAGIDVFYVERALPKLIQAVKARDEEVLGEEENDQGWDSGHETTIEYIAERNNLRKEIKQKMEETI